MGHDVNICGDVLQESASSRLLLVPKRIGDVVETIYLLPLFFCRLDHRHYLLEYPHKYSVADLRQVRALRGHRGFAGENIPGFIHGDAALSMVLLQLRELQR